MFKSAAKQLAVCLILLSVCWGLQLTKVEEHSNAFESALRDYGCEFCKSNIKFLSDWILNNTTISLVEVALTEV